MKPLETDTHKGWKIEVFPDEYADDPREAYPFGTMVCFHRRYTLGDKDHGYNAKHFTGWGEVYEEIRRREGNIPIYRLYLMDHGSISISLTPFNDPWDSGQVGFFFFTKEQIREFGWKRLTQKRLEELRRLAESAVHEYDLYLQGNAYWCRMTDPNGQEESFSGLFEDYDQVFVAAFQEIDATEAWRAKQRAKLETEAVPYREHGELPCLV